MHYICNNKNVQTPLILNPTSKNYVALSSVVAPVLWASLRKKYLEDGFKGHEEMKNQQMNFMFL